MSYQLRILSLGAGVQSTAIFLMSCLGVLPRVHCAIFADTGWESTATYQHLEWLEKVGEVYGIPIVRVGSDSLRERLLDRHLSFDPIPSFILRDGKIKMGRRQCTWDFKLEPIRKKIRSLLGLKPKQWAPRGAVELWIGISLDELKRTKTYRPNRMTHVLFPLIERVQMDRQQCIQWINKHFPGHIPPRSSCIGCPYHTDTEWGLLSDDEFADACLVDETLRNIRGATFLHRTCTPLAEIDFTDHRQLSLFDDEAQKHGMIITGLEDEL